MEPLWPRSRWRWRGGTLLFAVLVAQMTARAAAQQAATNQTCAPQLDSVCVANLRVEMARSPAIMASFDNLTERVLACAGFKGTAAGGGVIKPLRFLLPSLLEGILSNIKTLITTNTGFELAPDLVPFRTVGDVVLDTVANGRSYHDGWVSDARWTVELQQAQMVQPLDAFVKAAPALDWPDVHRFFRTSACVYNGSIIGIPLSGSTYVLFWHKPAFEMAGLSGPPHTWEELISVAAAINGSDWNGDGEGDYALCFGVGGAAPDGSCQVQEVVSAILASITQTMGTATGWLFNPETMESTVHSKAMDLAVDVLQRLLPYNLPGVTCDVSYEAFRRRKCAIMIQDDLEFSKMQTQTKGTSAPNPLWNKVGYALVPGSATVLDRTTSELVPCSASLCPFATWVNASAPAKGSNGTSPGPRAGQLVNRAPYGINLHMAQVNANTAKDYQQGSFSAFAIFSKFDVSMTLLTQTSGMLGPYRTSHFDTSSLRLALWRLGGFNPPDVVALLNVSRATLDSPNVALVVRMAGGSRFKAALSDVNTGMANGSLTTAAAVESVRATFNAISASLSPRDTAETYWAGLNLMGRSWSAPPPPGQAAGPAAAPAAGGPAPPQLMGSSPSSELSTGAVTGVVVGAVLGALALLAVAAVVLRSSRARVRGDARTPPGVGLFSTIAVTDIENSTLLWESVSPDVMDEALQMHHELARQLLVSHQGYESATEGDSFILGFFRPEDALDFALAFQERLRVLPWPDEVLASPHARTVYAMPVAEAGGAGKRSRLGPGGLATPWSASTALTAGRQTTSEAGSAAPPVSAHRQLTRAMTNTTTAFASGHSTIAGDAPEAGPPPAAAVSPSAVALTYHQEASQSGPQVASTPTSELTSGAHALAQQEHADGALRAPSRARSIRFAEGWGAGAAALGGAHAAQQLWEAGRAEGGGGEGPAQRLRRRLATIVAPQASAERSLDSHGVDAQGVPRRALSLLAAQWEPWTPAPAPEAAGLPLDGPEEATGAVEPGKGSPAAVAGSCRGDVQPDAPPLPGSVLIHRGLRVRVGLHTGVLEPEDASFNKTSGRMEYAGWPLSLAKTVADCGCGGMVLLTQSAFERLPAVRRAKGDAAADAAAPAGEQPLHRRHHRRGEQHGDAAHGQALLVNMGEYTTVRSGELRRLSIYQATRAGDESRLALLGCRLRKVRQIQTGTLEAPVNQAAIVFAHLVGASTLMAWNRDLATRAVELFENRAAALLLSGLDRPPAAPGGSELAAVSGATDSAARPGYIVEMGNGLALTAFEAPGAALVWGLRLISTLLAAPWDAELLEHELCEPLHVAGDGASSLILGVDRATPDEAPHEVADGAGAARGDAATIPAVPSTAQRATGGSHASRTSLWPTLSSAHPAGPAAHLLFRGPRVKIGVDLGPVHAAINPVTGRMAYRGRVMNRAARVGDRAGSGQVWCTEHAWSVAATEAPAGPAAACPAPLRAHALGTMKLKGVAEPVPLMQVTMPAHELDRSTARSTGAGAGAPAPSHAILLQDLDGIPRQDVSILSSHPSIPALAAMMAAGGSQAPDASHRATAQSGVLATMVQRAASSFSLATLRLASVTQRQAASAGALLHSRPPSSVLMAPADDGVEGGPTSAGLSKGAAERRSGLMRTSLGPRPVLRLRPSKNDPLGAHRSSQPTLEFRSTVAALADDSGGDD